MNPVLFAALTALATGGGVLLAGVIILGMACSNPDASC